ncbi:MAG: D-xylose ABC transporter ATP-binding protein [Planctomycetes bacterium RBG_13_44_8b]|nr:MAG: D-xylose ABC transporter ATP-binding protein [Planctomycetes bacterium RBG_13_44_8b]
MVSLSRDKVILEAKGIHKTFGGIKALDDVSIEIHADKVNAIVGENGAGKSTLMKILSGVYQDYKGQILLDGSEVYFSNPREAQNKGIAIIHQELNLIPYLSVAENIFLGREYVNSVGLVDYRRMNRETKDLLDKLNLQIDPQMLVSDLRVGQQQIVEIAKALSQNARVIIMDEPTSAISKREIDVLFGVIRSLVRQGMTIIYITHKLEELFQIADRVIVMRDGKIVGSRPLTGVGHDDVVRMMVGRDIKGFFAKTEAAQTEDVFRIQDMCLVNPDRPGDYVVNHISFGVKKGEVVGLFGLMGAGRTELLETIFGLHPTRSSGLIFLEDHLIRIDTPSSAIQAGIALVPEDRKLQGLIIEMSVRENISLANIEQVELWGFLNSRLENILANDYINRLKIKAASVIQKVGNLSGGNQQKVVLAKWLATKPKVILLDEPTRGIDVNAKNEIYKLISELAAAGLGIVMVSSELPEILAMSDRIIVLSEGRQTGSFNPSQASEEILLKAALPKGA